ncbi:unnamed protein product [Eruca vesicaria subsp. sativa]|uniref:GUCT domain-containing protein n=1 Tax=Eruca vesicaria subsp. sativa TaxID=29727 RepID=A0ABC8K9P4_ERUVS|nr:unnamed protein product [Eruca vesicaria subsp. sativa]
MDVIDQGFNLGVLHDVFLAIRVRFCCFGIDLGMISIEGFQSIKGWVTLQLIRDPTNSRGFLSARSVTGFLSDVYGPAADEVGKIFLIADEKMQGAVFDLPEDIAKELLEKEMPEGNSVSMITNLLALQDDGPSSDNYGRLSSRDRMPRGGGWGSRGSRFGGRGGSSRGRDSWGGDDNRRGRSSCGGGSSWSRGGGCGIKGSSDDWLIGSDRRSSSSSRAPCRERDEQGTCCHQTRVGSSSSFSDRSTFLSKLDIL